MAQAAAEWSRTTRHSSRARWRRPRVRKRRASSSCRSATAEVGGQDGGDGPAVVGGRVKEVKSAVGGDEALVEQAGDGVDLGAAEVVGGCQGGEVAGEGRRIACGVGLGQGA